MYTTIAVHEKERLLRRPTPCKNNVPPVVIFYNGALALSLSRSLEQAAVGGVCVGGGVGR